MTIENLLSSAVKKIDRLDAELLIAHVLRKPREFIISHPKFSVGTFNGLNIQRLVSKRTSGVPIAHLTGHKEFFGLDFLVNKHTLVPRPDTELLVSLAIYEIMNNKKEIHILVDVGTGSGCIPIAIHSQIANSSYQIITFATDVSSRALKVAKKNTKIHSAAIQFLQGNLLAPFLPLALNVQPTNHLIITANLPYVTEEQYTFEPSIQREPKLALVAQKDGLALYEELLAQISQLKHIHVISCFFEIDPSQSIAIKKLIKAEFPDANREVKKDLAGHDRIVCINIDNSVTKSRVA